MTEMESAKTGLLHAATFPQISMSWNKGFDDLTLLE